VDLTVRQVLGRLPKYTDPKAFTAALTATFELRAEQGHTVAVWQPRGFVGQTELGGSVTGLQASLYARATDALAAVTPVLHGLTALRTDADIQEMDAARSVVESQLNALVTELGTPGGARFARVEGIFDVLLRDPVTGQIDPVTGQFGGVPAVGMLGYLGAVFGLEEDRINTIEEEQVFSNFLLLRDYVTGLEASWVTIRDTLGRDLGTTLVLLSNALQVVGESVDEVTAALDSVFVGPAERTVTRFPTGQLATAGPSTPTTAPFRGGVMAQPPPSMLVSDLLSWISDFATQEAPELVQQAGRRGMGPVFSTGSTLSELVSALIVAIGGTGLPVGMQHPRVEYPLKELRTYLDEVVRLAAIVRGAPQNNR
jgi:hypothetical protein